MFPFSISFVLFMVFLIFSCLIFWYVWWIWDSCGWDVEVPIWVLYFFKNTINFLGNFTVIFLSSCIYSFLIFIILMDFGLLQLIYGMPKSILYRVVKQIELFGSSVCFDSFVFVKGSFVTLNEPSSNEFFRSINNRANRSMFVSFNERSRTWT